VHAPTPDFYSILKIFSKYKVDFIIVGGVCGVLHGAPVTTFDLDIVHSRAEENLARLLPALKKLEAYYRGRQSQRLKPKLDDLSSPGHHLLMTRFGPLDLLGTIGAGEGYPNLLEQSDEIEIEKMRLRVLTLEKLIEVKEKLGSEKDKAVLPILRQTLLEKGKKRGRDRK
jgi:hypothetical protein